jgi:hypothetical protein
MSSAIRATSPHPIEVGSERSARPRVVPPQFALKRASFS